MQKQSSKATVMATLEGYEWQINHQQIENLGPDADVTLIEIIEHPTLLNFYQIRALEVLRLFPKRTSGTFFRRVHQSFKHLRCTFETSH